MILMAGTTTTATANSAGKSRFLLFLLIGNTSSLSLAVADLLEINSDGGARKGVGLR